MGPYCNYCGHRCFTHMPAETPTEALKAYGRSTIIATCPAGQQFEKENVGWCYDDIQGTIAALTPPPTGQGNAGEHPRKERRDDNVHD